MTNGQGRPATRGGTGNWPPTEIFKNTVKAPRSLLVVGYNNKLHSFCPLRKFQLVTKSRSISLFNSRIFDGRLETRVISPILQADCNIRPNVMCRTFLHGNAQGIKPWTLPGYGYNRRRFQTCNVESLCHQVWTKYAGCNYHVMLSGPAKDKVQSLHLSHHYQTDDEVKNFCGMVGSFALPGSRVSWGILMQQRHLTDHARSVERHKTEIAPLAYVHALSGREMQSDTDDGEKSTREMGSWFQTEEYALPLSLSKKMAQTPPLQCFPKDARGKRGRKPL